MTEEKKDEGVGDSVKSLLKEALARQRDEMMNNFSQILRQLPTTVDASI
jgi:Tfp pilus assembly protein PilO